MVLSCGCDTTWTSYFDRCGPCKERISVEADIQNKRERARPDYERYGRQEHWYVTYDAAGNRTFKERT